MYAGFGFFACFAVDFSAHFTVFYLSCTRTGESYCILCLLFWFVARGTSMFMFQFI